MPAGTECDCTAQLLRSFRALHLLHRNAQRHQVTRRDGPTSDSTYLCVVVVVGRVVVDVVELECALVVVVVGTVNWRLSRTGPIGWATR
jgi:hypothetical protein